VTTFGDPTRRYHVKQTGHRVGSMSLGGALALLLIWGIEPVLPSDYVITTEVTVAIPTVVTALTTLVYRLLGPKPE